MSVIVILILASLAFALAFLAAFIWAVKSGQFEDTCTPGMRILGEDEAATPHISKARDADSPERRHVAGLACSDGVSRQHAGAPVPGLRNIRAETLKH